MIRVRSRGEMDITTVFGTVVVGSNPAESTVLTQLIHSEPLICLFTEIGRVATMAPTRVWFNGRTRPCQGRGESSILSTRTNSKPCN